MNLLEKLLFIQCEIDSFVKNMDVGTGNQAYKAVNSDQVLNKIRPLMNALNLLLEPEILNTRVNTGQSTNGTTRYLTELDMSMTWIDVDSKEERKVLWYAQGVDLAGEKGVGKANTYGEKYFFMKYFHVPTPKDDPDQSPTTKTGELKQKNTQAEKEKNIMYRTAIPQMLNELCKGDEDKIKQSYIIFTQNKAKQYLGVDNIDEINDFSLAIVYSKIKKTYKEKINKDFKITEN